VRGIPAASNNSLWSVVQIIALLIPIEGALWTERAAQLRWSIAALIVLVLCVVLSRESSASLGLGLRGISGAAWIVAVCGVVCVASIVVAEQWGSLTTRFGSGVLLPRILFYFVWALLQEFMLNSFFYTRFERILGNTSKAALVTALLFSLVHIPNPVLVPVTFVGGFFLVEAFRRWRNLYPLALAHAMCGLTLAVVVPDQWIRHMRVGLGFLTFHS
jgi:membrane protease YdiL (CAAX protease family)